MYAYYCLHKFRWLPSQFSNLDRREKAVVIAFINEYCEQEKKQHDSVKKR